MSQPLSMREILSDTINAKPITYRGIAMRSKLEAEFAWYLDECEFTWEYEPRIFGPVGEGYMPDFYIQENGDRCYVEVKPTLERANAAKDRMKVIWKSDPDAILIMVSGDGWWQAAMPGYDWESWRERWHGYKA